MTYTLRKMMRYSFLIVLHLVLRVQAVYIDGCPAYGCRPCGSFSFYLDLNNTSVSIDWGTSFVLDAVPNALGCSSDSVSIICQSNGPFTNNKGYVSLYRENGTIRWRDTILVHPTLPLLDNYGDVTGSDGVSLVHYDADGTKYPAIDCQGLVPIYSIELVGSEFLLLVSAKGDIVVRLTNGVPVGYITLDDVIGGVRGKFLPIAQPVVNDMRFYVLTEFVPDEDSFSNGYKTVQRLYAIDVRDSIVNRITVAWNYTFNDEIEQASLPNIMTRKSHIAYIEENTLNVTQGLLWKEQSNTIFVSLPPAFNATKSTTSLWGVRDTGTEGMISFRSDIQCHHMASFEMDTGNDGHDSPVWLANDTTVCSINSAGLMGECFNVSDLISPSARISTKLSIVRNKDSDTDVLIIGVVVASSGKMNIKSENFKFSFGVKSTQSVLAAIDVGVSGPKVLWTVPVPDGLEVKGQVTGSSGSDTRTKDKLIFYAENSNGVARIYSVS